LTIYRLSRGRTEATLDFDAYQIYVSELEGLKGNLQKGIVSLHGGGIDAEMPHPLSRAEARQLIFAVSEIVSSSLPVRIKVPGSRVNCWNTLSIRIKKKGKDERGTFYEGTASRGNCMGVKFNSVKIYESTLNELASSLQSLFNQT